MVHSEEDVQRLTHAFKNLINPFEVEVKEALFCLSSSAKYLKIAEIYLLNAEKFGKDTF